MSSPDGRRRWRLVRASTDAIPSWLRQLPSRSAPRRFWALPWRGIGIGVAILTFLAWVVFASPVLGVRSVEVTGLVMVDEPSVLDTAQVFLGTPLARVDTAGIKRRVGALAPVAGVQVSREWPSTLRIDIVERVPIGAVKRDNQFHWFDDQGVIFQSSESFPSGAVLVEPTDDRLIKSSVQVIRALTPELRSAVAAIKVDGPAAIVLALRDNRTVIWGDAAKSDEKAKVATAMLAQTEKPIPKQIDVSVPEIITIR